MVNLEMLKKLEALNETELKKYNCFSDAECKIQDRMLEIECKASIPEEYLEEYLDLQNKLNSIGGQITELLNSHWKN